MFHVKHDDSERSSSVYPLSLEGGRGIARTIGVNCNENHSGVGVLS